MKRGEGKRIQETGSREDREDLLEQEEREGNGTIQFYRYKCHCQL